MSESHWGKKEQKYTTVPQSFQPEGARVGVDAIPLESRENLIALTGIYWDAAEIDVTSMKQGGVEWAQARMRTRLPELIWSTAALEGNTFTLPEVQTLLDGVTVEGKKLEEQQQVLALQETFNFLDKLVTTRSFRLDSATSDEFHARVARHEAIESGHFRGFGSVTGGGNLRLSTGDTVEGLPAELIMPRFTSVVDVVSSTEDARLAALIYFAAATRAQFYFDGNKRTARMMASGLLMEHGYDALYIPFERRLEYNKCLDVLFTTNNGTALMRFLAECTKK